MRRLTAAVSVLAMLGGCTTYRTSKAIAILGAVGAAGGVVATIESHPTEAAPIPVGAVVVALGLSLALGGLFGMALYVNALTPEERVARAQRVEAETRRAERARTAAQAKERAWGLTNDAAASARAGDCVTVTARDREVRELDAEFHATVFMRDVAIKRCLDATAGGGQ